MCPPRGEDFGQARYRDPVERRHNVTGGATCQGYAAVFVRARSAQTTGLPGPDHEDGLPSNTAWRHDPTAVKGCAEWWRSAIASFSAASDKRAEVANARAATSSAAVLAKTAVHDLCVGGGGAPLRVRNPTR